jgi:hypothetical protein
VRVSSVDFVIRSGFFAAIGTARIRSAELAAPLVIYDATVNRPQSAAFTRHLDASAPGALDELHRVVCSGAATFEVMDDVTGATLAKAPVIPSNTGKC